MPPAGRKKSLTADNRAVSTIGVIEAICSAMVTMPSPSPSSGEAESCIVLPLVALGIT